ncbi:trifunctional dihydropteroate synthetase [Serendipita sp. 396]|nr:trifunctional dihydropteroate synthetase [Serendipita sp. 396]
MNIPELPKQRRILALALGSNIGDRVANIEGALSYLESNSDIRIVDTSFLYETRPMYVLDQPKFINGACLVSTAMDPQNLINTIKDAESRQGRLPGIRNGPRVVDLDVLFDDSNAYNLNSVPGRSLTVPHPKIHEREFVLRPLADMMPHFRHPTLKSTIAELLSRLSETSIQQILNFPAHSRNSDASNVVWTLRSQTFIMATLNTTPDSFSDGGDNENVQSALQYSTDAVETGADIVDIGGFSTRPGSYFVSEEEELSRTAPFIAALRKGGLKVPISIDTFRSSVAEKALDAGANCINDVYALTGPPEDVAGTQTTDISMEDEVRVSDNGAMLALAARWKVPVILMHSRGPADKNKDYSKYGGNILEAVQDELGIRVHRALKAGVRRWNIILDPGIGFSKSIRDNVILIRDHSQLTNNRTEITKSSECLPSSPSISLHNFPTLVGTSRKRFLGHLAGREETKISPKSRDWATAAAVTSLVQQNADILRVHAVNSMRDVIRVADGIWREQYK